MKEGQPRSQLSLAWIGNAEHLEEITRHGGRRTRALSTIADAAGMFEDFDNKRYIVLIELKYTDSYAENLQDIPVRSETYGKFCQNGRLTRSLVRDLGGLFCEPFVKLKRQQVWAHGMAKHKDLDAHCFSVPHIAPHMSKDRRNVT